MEYLNKRRWENWNKNTTYRRMNAYMIFTDNKKEGPGLERKKKFRVYCTDEPTSLQVRGQRH